MTGRHDVEARMSVNDRFPGQVLDDLCRRSLAPDGTSRAMEIVPPRIRRTASLPSGPTVVCLGCKRSAS
jgi:hypothetical protein